MTGTRIIEQWFKGHQHPETDYERRLDGKLLELERVMGEWYQALKFGPLPGAYLSFQWRAQNLSIAFVDAVVFPPLIDAGGGAFQMRPIFFGASIEGTGPNPVVEGNLVHFPDGVTPTDILSSDFVADEVASLNRRQDFAVEDIVFEPGSTEPRVFLDIRNITAGPIQAITCSLFVKNVSQVEP